MRTVINGGGEAGVGARAVYQPAAAYVGRRRRFTCLRCVCLATGEDFLVFMTLDEEGKPSTGMLDCPACGYEHHAVAAATALDTELIDREEFDFLCSPLDLGGEHPGNDTLRIRK